GDKALHAFVVLRPESWDRTRFLLERHGLRRLPDAPRGALPARPEAESYDRRRSVRRFTSDSVRNDDLRHLLTAAGTALGVRTLERRVDEPAAGPLPDYTVPDA